MPRKTHLDRPTQSQRKRRGKYMEARRAKDARSNAHRRKRRNVSGRNDLSKRD